MTQIELSSIATVESGKIFHGCPPLALGAQMRLRFSTVIMGDSHPASSHLGRILGFKPNYLGIM